MKNEKPTRERGLEQPATALSLLLNLEDVMAAFANGQVRALQAERDLRRARHLEDLRQIDEAAELAERRLLAAARVVAKGRELLRSLTEPGDGRTADEGSPV